MIEIIQAVFVAIAFFGTVVLGTWSGQKQVDNDEYDEMFFL